MCMHSLERSTCAARLWALQRRLLLTNMPGTLHIQNMSSNPQTANGTAAPSAGAAPAPRCCASPPCRPRTPPCSGHPPPALAPWRQCPTGPAPARPPPRWPAAASAPAPGSGCRGEAAAAGGGGVVGACAWCIIAQATKRVDAAREHHWAHEPSGTPLRSCRTGDQSPLSAQTSLLACPPRTSISAGCRAAHQPEHWLQDCTRVPQRAGPSHVPLLLSTHPAIHPHLRSAPSLAANTSTGSLPITRRTASTCCMPEPGGSVAGEHCVGDYLVIWRASQAAQKAQRPVAACLAPHPHRSAAQGDCRAEEPRRRARCALALLPLAPALPLQHPELHPSPTRHAARTQVKEGVGQAAGMRLVEQGAAHAVSDVVLGQLGQLHIETLVQACSRRATGGRGRRGV